MHTPKTKLTALGAMPAFLCRHVVRAWTLVPLSQHEPLEIVPPEFRMPANGRKAQHQA